MTRYHDQLRCAPVDIDLDFWRQPQGVSVPDDELGFLLVPDAAESAIIAELAQQVHHFQRERATEEAISHALMATMGGMLPGILLYDHLVHGRATGDPPIVFGTIGVSLYKGPNERYDEPVVQQDSSLDVRDQSVLVIDDLGDRGGTLSFLKDHLNGQGAARVLTLAVYMKPQALAQCPADFHFGEVDQDCWIITPRETVETLVKRVPVWRKRGADQAECRRRLVELIGYPPTLVDRYLPPLFRR
ncbi:MAG: phosphoribosyltransferase family protein [Pseudomonadota bacterium]